jgi:hypothetical protein
VADDASLDLTRAMTLEAWVRPVAQGARSVLVKERGNRLSYGLYARPSAHVFTTAEQALRGRPTLPRNRWSHLAMTWDGRIVRIYVDGEQVATHALAGTAPASDGPLRIGGNAIWPELFKGAIDEVRVYDRALGASEIARDRDVAIRPGAKRPKTKTARGQASADPAGGPPRHALALAPAAALLDPVEDHHEHDPREDAADDPGQPVAAEAHPARVEHCDERARRDLLGSGEAGWRLRARPRSVVPRRLAARRLYSHSIVPGGLLVMSSTTRFTSRISLIMREAICSSRS